MQESIKEITVNPLANDNSAAVQKDADGDN